jgi:hypothetical protein
MQHVLRLILALSVIISLVLTTGVAQAQPKPPPGKKPSPPPTPHARVEFIYSATPVTPTILTRGGDMIYTFELRNRDFGSESMDARRVRFELPLIGNQQFVELFTTDISWKLQEPVTNTVRVTLGDLDVGQGGTLIIKAKFATNFERAVLKQGVYAYWEDDNGATSTSRIMSLEVDLRQPAPGTPTTPQPEPPTPAPPTLTGPFAPVPYDGKPNTDTRWYFPATRHTLQNGFLQYWLAHGSVLNLGYPLSEEFSENGLITQYFERAVLEYHPKNPPEWKVLLRALGRETGFYQAQPSVAPATPGSIYFGETGHWLDGNFVETWQAMGGLRQFGFPISPSYTENGKLVQWTERARFELDITRPDQLVMLGRIGAEVAVSRGFLPQGS